MDISAEQEAKAKRMTKIFFQISEDLERDELIAINEIINNAAKYSNEKKEKELHLNLHRFFKLVTFKSGISVNLLNQGIRSLLMIQDVPELGNAVSDPIREQLVKEFPMLAAMGKIDEKSLQIYLKALKKGVEKLRHIRLMVVGMFGVGKTSLVRRLRGESIDGVKSTVGIDVNVKTCALNEDGSWINQTPEESKDSEFDKRLTDAVVQTKETTPQSSTSHRTPEPTQNIKQQPLLPQESETKIQVPKPFDTSLQVEKGIKVLKNLGKTEQGQRYVKHVQEATTKDTYSGRKPTISIWDFAGQSVYYSTHHFFLNPRSIYLLVLDISRPLNSKVEETEENESLNLLEGSMKKDYTCLDAFKFWVTSIYAYTQYRVGKDQPYKPSIVLVGTHGDKLVGNTKKKEFLKDKYFADAREHFEGTPVDNLFHDETFLISNKEDVDDVFNDLKKNITNIAKKQPYWNSNTPASWITLERSIEGEKDKGKELIKLSDVAGADEENECDFNEPEIKLFLEIQHYLGNVIYFDAKDLDETIILNPQWLVDIFKKFVAHRTRRQNVGNLQECWREYEKTAKLHKDLLDDITKTHKDGEKANESVDVVRYMEHLDVIAKPISEEKVDFHIVPCVLKQLTPEEYENKIKDLVNPEGGKSTYVLCFSFNQGCLPPSIFHRLMATYIKKMSIKKRGKELFVYNGFGAFELTSTITLCIWYADYIIYARVTLHDKKNDLLRTDKCIDIRKKLSCNITKILQFDQETIGSEIGHFKEHVLCEKAFLNNTLTVLQSINTFNCPSGLYEVGKMKKLISTDCHCDNSVKKGHIIERNMALRYWYEEPDYLQEVSKWFKKKVREKKTFLEEQIDDRDLVQLLYLVEVDEIPVLGKLLHVPNISIQQIQRSDISYELQVHALFKKCIKENKGLNNDKLKQIMFKLKENMALGGTK